MAKPYMAQVLDEGDSPLGTCFQVGPGLLLTAFHVLEELGRARPGQAVSIAQFSDGDPTAASPLRRGKLLAIEPTTDLAAIELAEPLCATSALLWGAGEVASQTLVRVAGVPHVVDPGHSYELLEAPGRWAGLAVRDRLTLGRMTASSVVPGMSGSCVQAVANDLVVGLVSARYNSVDNWLRDSVWVIPAELVDRFIRGIEGVEAIDQILVADHVTPAITYAFRGAVDQGNVAGPRGPRTTGVQAAQVLVALDQTAMGCGSLEVFFSKWVTVATATVSDYAQSGFAARLRYHGLDPRVLLPRLADHEIALQRWTQPVPGWGIADLENSIPLLDALREQLADRCDGISLNQLHRETRALLSAELRRGETAELPMFASVVSESLPPLRSTSREIAVLAGAGDVAERANPHVLAKLRRANSLTAAAAALTALPSVDPYFTGRDQELDSLRQLIRARLSSHGSARAFITGQPGVGKSALAIAAAHQLAEDFVGGVLYFDLRGLLADNRRHEAEAARIGGQARGLDSREQNTAEGGTITSFLLALERSNTLIVLDDAADATHVAHLVRVPKTCAVIVTSRDRSQGFADPELIFNVDRLPRSASVRLLHRMTTRSDDAEALDRIATFCDDLPLAVRIAAARLSADPDMHAQYLAQLLSVEVGRLDYLEVGSIAMRAAIGLSYDMLSPESRLSLRRLSEGQGVGLSARDVANALDAVEHQQELLFNGIVDANLANRHLFRQSAAGRLTARFAPHELVRLFAHERTALEDAESDVHEYRQRLAGWMLEQLNQLNDVNSDADLELELDTAIFHVAMNLAEQENQIDTAVDIALGLYVLYNSSFYQAGLDSIIEDRVRLLLARDKPAEIVKAWLEYAVSLMNVGRDEDASAAASRAVRFATERKMVGEQAQARFQRSLCLDKLGRTEDALADCETSANLYLKLGREVEAATVALNAGRLALRLRRSALALKSAQTATDLATKWLSFDRQAHAFALYADAYRQAGELDAAIDAYEKAAAFFERDHQLDNAVIDWVIAADIASVHRPDDVIRLCEEAFRCGRFADPGRKLLAQLALSAGRAAKRDYAGALEVLRGHTPGETDAPADMQLELALRRAGLALVCGLPGSVDEISESAVDLERVDVVQLRELRLLLAEVDKATGPTDEARQAIEVHLACQPLTYPKVEPWLFAEFGSQRPVAAQLT